MRSAPAEVVVGRDGVVVRRTGKDRFLPYDQITNIGRSGTSMSFTLSSGDVVTLRARMSAAEAKRCIDAVIERVREAESLRLVEVLTGEHGDVEQRIAAAVALAGRDDAEGRERAGGRRHVMSRAASATVAILVLAVLHPASAQNRRNLPPDARFHASVSAVNAAQLPHSWHAGCPVSVAQLRLLTVTHWGFDGAIHSGRVVVNAAHADGLVRVLRGLFAAHFAIERLELVDAYDGDDHRSMAANNTSAFNCREVAGRPGVWSQHASGLAIDINPIQNPYVSSGTVSPPAGSAYLDRHRARPGLIRADDVVVRLFAAIGWRWGGNWVTQRDYQHFSSNGR